MKTGIHTIQKRRRQERSVVRRLPDIVQFATDPDLLDLALSPAQETL
jgi:hypothetical protein